MTTFAGALESGQKIRINIADGTVRFSGPGQHNSTKCFVILTIGYKTHFPHFCFPNFHRNHFGPVSFFFVLAMFFLACWRKPVILGFSLLYLIFFLVTVRGPLILVCVRVGFELFTYRFWLIVSRFVGFHSSHCGRNDNENIIRFGFVCRAFVLSPVWSGATVNCHQQLGDKAQKRRWWGQQLFDRLEGRGSQIFGYLSVCSEGS